jgi:hypothetical protein
VAERKRTDDRLETVLRHLASGASPADARKAAKVNDKLWASWLEDPTTRKRIEAAQRGVAPPEIVDGDEVGAGANGSFPWEQFVNDPIGRLRAIDRVLASSGFHAMSEWWDWTFECFYASGKFQLTARVGRRGGKSSDVSRVAVSEGVGTMRNLPPGESGVWPIISHTMPEAHDRLDTIEAILKALAFRQVDKKPEDFGTYQRTTELGRKLIRTLDIARNTIEWTVFPASINGVSGFTAIGAMCDEGAKWKDDKTGANPASIVLGSLRPCFATQSAAHLFFISSAFSTIDAHHDAIEEGDTDMQFLARLGERGAANDSEQRARAVAAFEARSCEAAANDNAADAKMYRDRADALRASIGTVSASSPNVPTWATHPALTIERTLFLEADFPTWLREYASVPTGSGLAYFFDHPTIDRCNALPLVIVKRTPNRVGIGIDPGLEVNAFSAAAWGLDDDGAWLLDALELLPAPGAPLDDEESFSLCAEFALRNGGKHWMTDTHYQATARRIGAKNKISMSLAPNDNGMVFLEFRREAGRGRIRIDGHALSTRIARQLKGVQSQPMAGGRIKIVLPREAGGTHGDVASAAVRGWWSLQRPGQVEPLWLPTARRSGRRVA